MARRAPTKRSISHSARRAKSHVDKLRTLSSIGVRVDPTNKRAVTKKYRELSKFPPHLFHKANKDDRERLKKKGFFVTDKGVIIDGPRDRKRKPIATRRFDITSYGDIKWSVNGRRDYIVGLTPKEKIEFAKDTKAFIKKHRALMRERYPDFREASDIQVRLQWGAYQATKDFVPGREIQTGGKDTDKQFRLLRREKTGGKNDILTGLHYVIHVTKKTRQKRRKRRRT